MSFLLDTNICSAHIRRPAGLAARFIQYGEQLHIPTLVLAELYSGAYRIANFSRLLTAIDDLRRDLIVLPFDEQSAHEFGKLTGELHRIGISTSTVDAMIAAVAIANDLTLVTHNANDFRFIPGLRIVDWLVP
jgi:tRNA(fMet)-specific endonuclease VapC